MRYVKGGKSFSLQAEEVLAEVLKEAGSSGDVLFFSGIRCFLNGCILGQLPGDTREVCGYRQGIPDSSSLLVNSGRTFLFRFS